MILELVGLPGAGKTTFAKKLEQTSGFVRVKISGRSEILWYNVLFLLRHPFSTASQLTWLFRYRGDRRFWYTKFANLFLVHNAKYMKACCTDRAIIDQGHLQNIVSLFEEKIGEAALATYVSIFPKPDYVLVFAPLVDAAERRMAERGYGVREGLSAAQRTEWLSEARRRLELLPEMLINTGISVASLENDKDAEEALLRFCAPVAIYYLHNTRMPTEKAHGGQIARMCAEWATLGARVTLMAGFRDEHCAGGDVAAYYGVEKNFFTRFIARNSLHTRLPQAPKLAYFFNNFSVYLRLMWWRPEKGAIIFTRRPELAWLFKMKGLTTVYECHEWFAHGWRLPYYFGTRADLIVTINRYTGEEFLKHGFSKDRLMTETNGVFYEAFALPITPKVAKEIAELPSKKMVILYTGGLKMMGEDKGVKTILESLREMRGQDVLFVAVGGKASEIAEFKEMAEKLGVAEMCLFIPRKSRDELAMYQRAADALLIVHPRTHLFEYYMAPLKTFEYMASGRPIIASDLLSLREIMDDETAFWVIPGDAKDLARAIEKIKIDPIEAERRAKNVQEKSKQCTWHARAERLLARFRLLNATVK